MWSYVFHPAYHPRPPRFGLSAGQSLNMVF